MPWIIISFLWLLVAFIILGGIYWIFLQFPLPDPIPRVTRVIFTVICFVILLLWLLSLLGMVQVFPGPIHGIIVR